MNKLEIKNILMSMRTQDNAQHVNHLLGKVDILSDKIISEYLKKIGDPEENIRDYFNEQIEKMKVAQLRRNEKYPINKLFTYGVSQNKNCIHLHLPDKLHTLIRSKGSLTATMDTVNLYLLDAIDKLIAMNNSNHSHFNNIHSIYMISPILIQRELDFLKEMDFVTLLYQKKDLQNKEFVDKHTEAQLAVHLFENDKNVGKAEIPLDVVSSKEWQKKKANKVKEFNDKGIFIEEDENIK